MRVHGSTQALDQHESRTKTNPQAHNPPTRTGNLSVIEASKALATFWELPFERICHCLEEQSLWAVVHFDDYDAVTEMQVGVWFFGGLGFGV